MALHITRRAPLLCSNLTIRTTLQHRHFQTKPLILLHNLSTTSRLSSLSTHSSSTLRPSQPFDTKLNPPASTRPPPLSVPTRGASQGRFSYLYGLAKAYLKFYRAALGYVLANRRLARDVRKRVASEAKAVRTLIQSRAVNEWDLHDLGEKGPSLTRGEMQLLHRSKRDMSRLPLFGLLFLVTFEFFPLVVFLFSKQLAPRLPVPVLQPEQEQLLRLQAVQRWKKAEERWGQVDPDNYLQYVGFMADFHGLAPAWIPRSLTPWFLLTARVNRHVEYLRYDDALLGKDTVSGLVDEEVVIAAVERGLWDESVKMDELRSRLQKSINTSWEMEKEMKAAVDQETKRERHVKK